MTQNAPAFPKQAWDTVVRKVYAPHFFNKLASDWPILNQLGIDLRDDASQGQLLKLASWLRHTSEGQVLKQAQAGGSFLKQAADNLQSVLQAHGISDLPDSSDALIKQAAAQYLADADLQAAELEFGSWLVQQPAAA